MLEGDAPDRWEHVVRGDGDDAGLVFRFRWVPVDAELHLFGRPHPFLRSLAEPIHDA